MNIVDIVIIAILLLFIILGVRKGFAFSLLSLFGGIVNLFLSILLTKPINTLTNNWGLASSIKASYASNMAGMSGFETNLVGLNQTDLTNHINSSLNSSSLSGFTKKITSWFLKVSPEQIADKENVTLSNILSTAYSNFWSTLIAFAISFILITLVLFILSKLTKKFKENKVFNSFDKLFGFIFGALRGAIYICLLLAILSCFNPNGLLSGVYDYIYQSKIGNFALTNVKALVDKYINIGEIIKDIIAKI